MSRVLLFGAGATGARIARQLRSTGAVEALEVRDPNEERLSALTASFDGWATQGSGRRIEGRYDAVVIATPPGSQVALARRAVHAGAPAITTSNQTSEVRRLLALDDEAGYHEVPVVVGAGFMPGLTCLLARHGARDYDEVPPVGGRFVARFATGDEPGKTRDEREEKRPAGGGKGALGGGSIHGSWHSTRSRAVDRTTVATCTTQLPEPLGASSGPSPRWA